VISLKQGPDLDTLAQLRTANSPGTQVLSGMRPPSAGRIAQVRSAESGKRGFAASAEAPSAHRPCRSGSERPPVDVLFAICRFHPPLEKLTRRISRAYPGLPRVCRDVIAKLEATSRSFLGDGVLAIRLSAAHEDDARRAVEAALEYFLEQAEAMHHGASVRVRMGITRTPSGRWTGQEEQLALASPQIAAACSGSCARTRSDFGRHFIWSTLLSVEAAARSRMKALAETDLYASPPHTTRSAGYRRRAAARLYRAGRGNDTPGALREQTAKAPTVHICGERGWQVAPGLRAEPPGRA